MTFSWCFGEWADQSLPLEQNTHILNNTTGTWNTYILLKAFQVTHQNK